MFITNTTSSSCLTPLERSTTIPSSLCCLTRYG
ncbi:unnamed protein product [Linum tenue]|uniref:Uncharacterized protein n=1 Tax=Linum tenue TaxID=586396 RepID=A0AAV0I6M6_9ROSI|nr:unnamed protein product [Linum tenue]